MTMTVEWVVEGQICLVTAPPVVDAAVLKAYDEDMIRFLNSASRPVYLIIDLQKLKKLGPVAQLLTMKHPRHPHFKYAITLGLSLNTVSRFMVPMISQILGIHYKDFSTLDDALAYIESMEQA